MAEESSNAMYYSVKNLDSLSEDLAVQAKAFSDKIDSMYNSIYSLETNNFWKGQTYTQFKLMCDNFKNNKINDIISKLYGWSKGFSDVSTDASDTTAKNKAIFENNL